MYILFCFLFWRSLASRCVENSCKKNLCEVSNLVHSRIRVIIHLKSSFFLLRHSISVHYSLIFWQIFLNFINSSQIIQNIVSYFCCLYLRWMQSLTLHTLKLNCDKSDSLFELNELFKICNYIFQNFEISSKIFQRIESWYCVDDDIYALKTIFRILHQNQLGSR